MKECSFFEKLKNYLKWFDGQCRFPACAKEYSFVFEMKNYLKWFLAAKKFSLADGSPGIGDEG